MIARITRRRQGRQRGQIETHPSEALRVVVYAVVDPINGKRNYLRETVPAGPNADTEADKVLVRLVNEVTSAGTRAPARP